MTKKEMIKILMDDEDNTFTFKELNKLNKDNVQEIFESIYEVEYEDENFTEDLKIQGLKFGDDYIDDTTIERELVEKHSIDAEAELIKILQQELEKTKKEEVEEVVEIDLTNLSVVEQRAYRRTGILPQITINRYTRFDDETPKMDN